MKYVELRGFYVNLQLADGVRSILAQVFAMASRC